MTKTIHLQYYAIFREQSGKKEESLQTDASTLRELFEELKAKYNFSLPCQAVKVALNDEFQNWQTPFRSKDRVVFIAPTSGG